jgi:dihydrofolate reductase
MGKIVVTEFISLDGVVEDPGGVEGFKHGGWVFEFNQGDEGIEFKLHEALSSEAMLLGRATYDTFASSWPAQNGEWADKLNSMPKYVVSSTLRDPLWNNTTVVSDDLKELVAVLKSGYGGDVLVHGSTQLAQALLDQDLVDELRLMVFPVVLGSGKRLFGDMRDKKPLRQVSTRTIGDGVTILIYEPIRVSGEAAEAPDRSAQRAAVFDKAGISPRAS